MSAQVMVLCSTCHTIQKFGCKCGICGFQALPETFPWENGGEAKGLAQVGKELEVSQADIDYLADRISAAMPKDLVAEPYHHY